MTALERHILQLRGEMHAEFSAIRTEFKTDMKALGESLIASQQQGDEDTRTFMRLLFEKHREGLRLVGEGRRKGPKKQS